MKWHHRFMDLATHIAQWSKDPSTKVGCVIVDHDRRIVGSGYNGFPRGVRDAEERYAEKQVKYRMVVHSEANAILNAVSSVKYTTLYCTKAPCSSCTQLIIQAGIDRVVSPPYDMAGTWAEDAHYATQMLQEASITLVQLIDGKFLVLT